MSSTLYIDPKMPRSCSFSMSWLSPWASYFLICWFLKVLWSFPTSQRHWSALPECHPVPGKRLKSSSWVGMLSSPSVFVETFRSDSTFLKSEVREVKYTRIWLSPSSFWMGYSEHVHFFLLCIKHKWNGGFKSQQPILIRSPAITGDV